MNIDAVWSPAGRLSAESNGIALSEAITVVYARTSIALVYPRAIWYIGVADQAVITVITDKQRSTGIYEITVVRHASAEEARAWKRKQP